LVREFLSEFGGTRLNIHKSLEEISVKKPVDRFLQKKVLEILLQWNMYVEKSPLMPGAGYDGVTNPQLCRIPGVLLKE
jgi:hypothetical protein